jgi:hypothetical protein
MVRAPRSAHACSGHDEHRYHGPDLGDGAVSRTGARVVGSAELEQQDVEGKDQQHGEWNRQHDRRHQRYAGDEPRLLQELPPGERSPRKRDERIERHREEAARADDRLGQLASS